MAIPFKFREDWTANTHCCIHPVPVGTTYSTPLAIDFDLNDTLEVIVATYQSDLVCRDAKLLYKVWYRFQIFRAGRDTGGIYKVRNNPRSSC